MIRRHLALEGHGPDLPAIAARMHRQSERLGTAVDAVTGSSALGASAATGRESGRWARWKGVARLLFELTLYGGFTAGYVMVVLHALGAWLKQLFDEDRHAYALLALALIIAQGVLLEILTGMLVRSLRSKLD